MRIFTAVLILLTLSLQAQVSLSSSELDFGDVYTTGDKEMGVDVTNTSSNELTITKVVIYNSAYSYSLASTTIAVGSSQKFRVTFNPIHNLDHNSELIFTLNNGNEFRINLIGQGRYEDTYYSDTYNKTHQALKDELKSIISAGYVNKGYSGARDLMYGSIDNVGGKVTCAYTGRQATFNTRSGANSNSFNCEHTWPQSLFNQDEPERADIHHLFPTDASANSRRSNYPFGVVSSASWQEGGSKLGGGKFEPRDVQKGATARAMIYFAIRYGDVGNFIDAQESILKQWHATYDPSAQEIARNNSIYSHQKNRNPFVDHPEFLDASRMNKIGSNDTKPVIKNAELLEAKKNYGVVSVGATRDIYITNTGNQQITDISNITTGGKVEVQTNDASAAVGEASQLRIAVANLADGSYRDTVRISLTSQVGKTLVLPIEFTVGTSKIYSPPAQKLQVTYDSGSRLIRVIGIKEGVHQLSIINLAGQTIQLNELNSNFTDIPFQPSSAGFFFVVIKSGDVTSTSRIYAD